MKNRTVFSVGLRLTFTTLLATAVGACGAEQDVEVEGHAQKSSEIQLWEACKSVSAAASGRIRSIGPTGMSVTIGSTSQPDPSKWDEPQVYGTSECGAWVVDLSNQNMVTHNHLHFSAPLRAGEPRYSDGSKKACNAASVTVDVYGRNALLSPWKLIGEGSVSGTWVTTGTSGPHCDFRLIFGNSVSNLPHVGTYFYYRFAVRGRQGHPDTGSYLFRFPVSFHFDSAI